MITIAIANQKGGVGKTTTAVTIAHGLAQNGRRVLIIDLDSQGNVSDLLGLEPAGNVAEWLADKPGMFITTARPNLSVIQGDKTTANLKTSLAARGFAEYVLIDKLSELGFYDLVLLDLAPSIDILQVSALMAADWLIIPAKLDQLAVKGVGETLESVSQLRRRGVKCEVAGILPTFWERTTKESLKQLENLVSAFGDYCWAPVPVDTRARAASRAGKTLWEYAPKCRALTDGYAPACYRVERLLSRYTRNREFNKPE